MSTVGEGADCVNIHADQIRWATTDEVLFEDLDVDVTALSREALEGYAVELRGECRFLRIAWHRASERIPADHLDKDFRDACGSYRDGIVTRWRTESEPS